MPTENVQRKSGDGMSKYVCVFCDERKSDDTAHIINDKNGICLNCSEELSHTPPSLPYSGTKNISYIMSPFEYNGKLRKTIVDFKFNNCRSYAALFADMMCPYLDSYNMWDTFDYIIPVPLHSIRLKNRGYNQSELISRYLSEYLHIPHKTDGFIRTRATKRQSTLNGLARTENVRGAFKCTENFTGKRILLFDDICTTANTLESCAVTLKNSGAEYICALTLAIHVSQKIPILTY